MHFFTMSKTILFGGGGGARVSELFLQRIQI